MVLVSFALVVVATITLVVGLLQSGLTLIYVSIACSVLAGLVLAVAVLRGRPEEAPAAAPARPAPVSTGAGPGPSTPPPTAPVNRPWQAAEPSPATAGGSTWGATSTAEPPPAPAPPPPEPEREPEYAGISSRPWASDRTAQMDVVEDDSGSDEDFPIPDYDRLRASEILRLLPGLSPGELERVRAREVSGMNRFTVLSRIDAQLESASERGWDIRDQEWAEATVAAEEAEEVEAEEAEELEPVETAPAEPEPTPVGAGRRTARAPRGFKQAAEPVSRARTRKAGGGRLGALAAEEPEEEEAPVRKAPGRRAPARAAAAPEEESAVTKRASRSRKAAPAAEPAPAAPARAKSARKAKAAAAPGAADITLKRGTKRAAAAPAKEAAKKAPARKATAKKAAKAAPAKVTTKTAKTAKKAAGRPRKSAR